MERLRGGNEGAANLQHQHPEQGEKSEGAANLLADEPLSDLRYLHLDLDNQIEARYIDVTITQRNDKKAC